MIKKLLLAAVAVSAIAATPAMASTDFPITGTIAPSCGALTGTTANFATGITVDSSGNLNTAQSASTTATSYCNGVNSTIAITGTTSLTGSKTTGDAAFTNVLIMAPSVSYGATTFLQSGGTQTIGALSGTLTVSTGNLTATASKKPVAGDYTGTITVALSPVV